MTPVELALEDAEIAVEAGKPDEARQILAAAMETMPGEASLLSAKSELDRLLGDIPEALRTAHAAITADANHIPARLAYARALADHDMIDDAITHARIAVRLDPRDLDAHLTLARALVWAPSSRATRSEVRESLEYAAASAPGNVAILAWVAHTYLLLGAKRSAGRHIESGLAADPTDLDLQLLQSTRDFDHRTAIARLTRVLDARPDDPGAREILDIRTWGALSTPLHRVWSTVAVVALIAMWAVPAAGIVGVLSCVFYVAPAFDRLRTRLPADLPPGYLWERVRHPAPLTAIVLAAAGTAVTGAGIIRLAWKSPSDHATAYLVILIGVWITGLAHLILTRARLRWMNRYPGDIGYTAARSTADMLFVGAIMVLILFAVLTEPSRARTELLTLIWFVAFVYVVEEIVFVLVLRHRRSGPTPVRYYLFVAQKLLFTAIVTVLGAQELAR